MLGLERTGKSQGQQVSLRAAYAVLAGDKKWRGLQRRGQSKFKHLLKRHRERERDRYLYALYSRGIPGVCVRGQILWDTRQEGWQNRHPPTLSCSHPLPLCSGGHPPPPRFFSEVFWGLLEAENNHFWVWAENWKWQFPASNKPSKDATCSLSGP